MLKRVKVPDNDIQSLKHGNNVYHCKPHFYFMTRIMKNLLFAYAKNTLKPPDQLCGNHTADHILCFRDIDSRIPKLTNSEISRYTLRFLTDLFGNPNDAFFSRCGSYKSGVKRAHIAWTCLRQYMFRTRGSILGPPDTGYESMTHNLHFKRSHFMFFTLITI